MGDRGNIYITDSSDDASADGGFGIYLYTHWSGYTQPQRVQQAVKAARPRWGDSSYATRIIIDQLIKESRDQEHGGGISLSIGDNEYEIVCIDVGDQVVGFASPGSERDRTSWYHVVTFNGLADAPAFEGYPVEGQPAPWDVARNAARIAELEAELIKLRGPQYR